MKTSVWFKICVVVALVVLLLVVYRQEAQIRDLQRVVAYWMEKSTSPSVEGDLDPPMHLGLYDETKKDVLSRAADATGTKIWFGPPVDRRGYPSNLPGMVTLYGEPGDKSVFWAKVRELDSHYYDLEPIPTPR